MSDMKEVHDYLCAGQEPTHELNEVDGFPRVR
jgi:hypothetical protein